MSQGSEFDNSNMPRRYRLLVLGGGVHGLGVLHDLASRGWGDAVLVEKGGLGSGTSSRSTKLIHGGLRYLQRVSGFALVNEALRERQILMRVAPEITRPMKFCFPVLKDGGYPGFYIKAGLHLYDFLAGKHNIKKHGFFGEHDWQNEMPILRRELFSKAYSFYDTQTDDLRLIDKIGRSAQKLGAEIKTHTEALSIQPTKEGWIVRVRCRSGELQDIHALYVVNALGPWANNFLEANDIEPHFDGVNNKGVHLLVPNLGHQVGAYLQSPKDKRIFFILPWYQYSLIGTTESAHNETPDKIAVDANDVDYILERCNAYLRKPIKGADVSLAFAGLRWLAKERGVGISSMSRSDKLSFHPSLGRGGLVTIYGGKLTTYRSLSQKIGDQICRDFGEFVSSKTADTSAWDQADTLPNLADDYVQIASRFGPAGVGYTPLKE